MNGNDCRTQSTGLSVSHRPRRRCTRSAHKPTRPLGRGTWIFGEFPSAAQHLPATLATPAEAIQTVTCPLASSGAFRVLQESRDSHTPVRVLFDPRITEVLFAALYMLGDQFVQTFRALLEREGADSVSEDG